MIWWNRLIFPALGSRASSALLEALPDTQKSTANRIKSDPWLRPSSLPNVFAAGGVADAGDGMTIVATSRQLPWLKSTLKALMAGKRLDEMKPYKPWGPKAPILVPLGPKRGNSFLGIFAAGDWLTRKMKGEDLFAYGHGSILHGIDLAVPEGGVTALLDAKSAVLEPAGLDHSTGIISTQYLKEPSNPAYAEDADVQAWQAFKADYFPKASDGNWWDWSCYSTAYTIEHVLTQAGDELTRENLMRVASNLDGFEAPMLLPGITVTTSADDFAPIEAMSLMKFDGDNWALFGDVIAVD